MSSEVMNSFISRFVSEFGPGYAPRLRAGSSRLGFAAPFAPVRVCEMAGALFSRVSGPLRADKSYMGCEVGSDVVCEEVYAAELSSGSYVHSEDTASPLASIGGSVRCRY